MNPGISHPPFTPVVPRSWLYATSGVVWSAVGFVLCAMAWHWLANFSVISPARAVVFGLTGLALSLAGFRPMFRKIAAKNIARIETRKERTCFFAFQAWRSYGLVLFMIALGITLRHSALPKQYLAIIYTMIGSALLLASVAYHVRFWQDRRNIPQNPAV